MLWLHLNSPVAKKNIQIRITKKKSSSNKEYCFYIFVEKTTNTMLHTFLSIFLTVKNSLYTTTCDQQYSSEI